MQTEQKALLHRQSCRFTFNVWIYASQIQRMMRSVSLDVTARCINGVLTPRNITMLTILATLSYLQLARTVIARTEPHRGAALTTSAA